MKREAQRTKRSLNAEIIHALEMETTEIERRRQMNNLREELARFSRSLGHLEDSVPLIREDRER